MKSFGVAVGRFKTGFYTLCSFLFFLYVKETICGNSKADFDVFKPSAINRKACDKCIFAMIRFVTRYVIFAGFVCIAIMVQLFIAPKTILMISAVQADFAMNSNANCMKNNHNIHARVNH